MIRTYLLAFLIFTSTFVFAQQIDRFNPDSIKSVVIDTPMVNIVARKLSVQDFIDAMLKDTSFYDAFRNMKKYRFIAENNIYVYDKRNKVEGKIYRKLRHSNERGGHRITFMSKLDSGKVYKKNGKYQFYTVEMFDYIFMNAYNTDFVNGDDLGISGGKNESYKAKLKTLIFTPGKLMTGVPFISKKTAVFSPEMRRFYRYEFALGTYLDSIPVYRFKVIQRLNLLDDEKDQVMIKELTTIFDTRTFQILGRYVDMKFNNLLFSFDVQMNIELNNFGGALLPVKISYQGNWDIPFKKEERASFLIHHLDYQLE
ncbi:MAG: hypothetical protein ACOH2A_03260 [Sphingobacteriaceae bacterium]